MAEARETNIRERHRPPHNTRNNTWESRHYDHQPGPPVGGVPVLPGLPGRTMKKFAVAISGSDKAFGLEERVALNKDIKHDGVTPRDLAINGLVQEDEHRVRCVACFAVVRLSTIKTADCLLKAHQRVSKVAAYGEFACHFITKLTLLAELKVFFGKQIGEMKAAMKVQTDEMHQEMQVIRQLSESVNTPRPYMDQNGFLYLLFSPVIWVQMKLMGALGLQFSNPANEIELKEKIEKLESRITDLERKDYYNVKIPKGVPEQTVIPETPDRTLTTNTVAPEDDDPCL